MAKIQVEKLAQMMGVEKQDLIFKLRSIGVRVEGEDAQIDSDVLQAFLQGKRMPQPREVILRDPEAQAKAPTTPTRRPPPSRRLPPNPLRAGRRRTMIQRVEPRIKTIPTAERTAPAKVEQPTPPPIEAAETVTAASETAPTTAPAVEPTSPPVAEPVAETSEEKATSRGQRRAERKRSKPAKGDLPADFVPPEEPITVSEGMTVREFGEKLGIKAKDLIQLLVRRGVMATINQVIDPDLAIEIAADLEVDAMEVSFEEEVQLQQEAHAEEAEETVAKEARAPVVTIMGHVDHGKTTLLDAIRSSNVTEGEFGGITQHIGAYEVESGGRKIVFLDTPGHEAFTRMRARGAGVTDIVVLVVAADDGVMPQTLEAIDHAEAAKVPIVVAINKMDRTEANADRVKTELAERGLTVEDWGGETVSIGVSALKGEGLDELLELILLTADLLELKASPDLPAQGAVIEARKEPGRGTVSTVLVQDGTLGVGDIFVSGAAWGRVRSMSNDRGERLREAGPATAVEVTGLSDVPEAGDPFQVVDNEAKARSIAEFRRQEQRQRSLSPTQSKLSLEQLFQQIREGDVQELPVVLKADVRGSLEVLTDTLNKLSTDQVRIKVIHSGIGGVTTNDVLLASASKAIIFGFNVRPEKKAVDLAEREEVDIRLHTVIYELSDEIQRAMVGLLAPTYREVDKGRAEVRQLFKVPKVGSIAGCHVVEGVIPRSAAVRLVRDSKVIYEGKIASLRRFKEDATEVRSGFDCGIGLERFQDLKPGDSIEAYVMEEVAPTL